MGVSRKAGTWLAVLAGVTVVVVGWAFFAVALTTDVFSGDGIDDRAIVVSAPSSGEGNAVATIDVAALEAHLAAVDERIAALEDAQANAPAVVSGSSDTSPISVDVAALEERLAAADEHLAAADERVAAMDEHLAAADERVAAMEERVAALEDAAESVDQPSPTQGVPPHDHLTSPVSTFPHVWTRTGNTLPEEFLQVHLAEGLWHFEFEAACLGDLSSCPRPGDRPPVLLVRDLVEDPFGRPGTVESGTEWCENVETDRDLDWRLWMANVRGVTWSLTIDEGECPQPGE